MRVLIVGGGGREHALLWKLRRDHPEGEFYATRPNGGMVAECTAVDIGPTDTVALAGWAGSRLIDLAVVGPETPLAKGLADQLRKIGIPTFGPSKAAAQIEASKAFSKGVMAEAGVPTAAFETFTDPDQARDYIEGRGAPIVVKASGLAAGKGAVVCETVPEALRTVEDMMGGAFGEAGREVVIEEFMTGEELSVFYLTDGEHFVPLLPSQDHKRIHEGDRGPNTGGMGAYAPVGLVTPSLLEQVGSEIVGPTLAALADRGAPFQGVLFVGLMVGPDGPRVVEFNCRFGDPETQALLPLLSSSLMEAMVRIAEGSGISGYRPEFRAGAAVTTVLASGGYPGSYETGLPIRVPNPLPDDTLLFHAGTRRVDGGLVTSGGRVVAVTGLGPDFSSAQAKSRAGAELIDFEGRQFRGDIGWREAARA